MAPYRMKIELVNQTEYHIRCEGRSTLKNLDGYTNLEPDWPSTVPASTATFEIVKGGGTAGLFTTVIWSLNHEQEKKTQFALYSEMGASSWSTVFVGLQDAWGMSDLNWTPPNESSIADNHHSYHGDDYPFPQSLSRNWTTVTIERVSLGYPNSHIRLILTQDWNDPKRLRPLLEWLEGRRIRSPDGGLHLVLDNKVRWISDMGTYGSMFSNFDFWNYPQQAFNAMAKGDTINRNPALITAADNQDGGKIYLVDNGQRRWIQNPETFNRYGFDWNKVARVDVRGYPEGSVIKI